MQSISCGKYSSELETAVGSRDRILHHIRVCSSPCMGNDYTGCITGRKFFVILFETKVLIGGVPTPMQFRAQNAHVARTYFESFGKIVGDVRIIQE